MPDDFVQQMRDSLQKQQSQNQLSTEAQLHYAKVLQTEGPKKWQELKTWLMESADNINRGLPQSLIAYGEDADGLGLTNKLNNRGIQVSFKAVSADISYRGANGEGIFRPQVKGNTLEYSWQATRPCENESRGIRPDDSRTTIDIPKMGEIVIRCVVTPGH